MGDEWELEECEKNVFFTCVLCEAYKYIIDIIVWSGLDIISEIIRIA